MPPKFFQDLFLSSFVIPFIIFCSFNERLHAQVFNASHAGIYENGFGAIPNLTGASSVFVEGNYAYVVGFGNALEILDITMPGAPIRKGGLVNGEGGANLIRPQNIIVSGNYAYITCYGGNALEIVDVTDPANPVHKATLLDGGGQAPYLNGAWGLFISGNYAFVTSGNSNALEIIDISNPARPVHHGSILGDASGNGAYLNFPLSVFVVDNYAYVGSNDALEIVDISDLSSPVHKGSIVNSTPGVAPFLGQPYGMYVANNHAYLTDRKNNAIEIIDVSNPATPVHKGSLVNGVSGAAPYLRSPWAITASGNYAYVTNSLSISVPAGNPFSAVEIIDISNPALPAHAGALTSGNSRLYASARSIFIKGNRLYTVSTTGNSSNDGGMTINDISNPIEPSLVGSIFSGSNGAPLNSPQSVVVSGKYAYVVSSTSQSLAILDVSNPVSPVLVSKLLHGTSASFFPNPHAVYVSGNFAYILSGTSPVIEVVNIGNPFSPIHWESISTAPYFPMAMTILGNSVATVVTSSLNYNATNLNPTPSGRLEVYNISEPANIQRIGTLDNGTGGALLNNPTSVNYFQSNTSYVCIASNGNNALEIVNVGGVSPVHVSSLTDGTGGALLKKPTDVFVSGNYAYITSSEDNALEIVDITNPQAPVHKGSIVDGTGGVDLKNPNSVVVFGNYALVTSSGSSGVAVIDVSNPAAPQYYGNVPHLVNGALLDAPNSISVSGRYAYVTNAGIYSNLNIIYLLSPSVTSFTPTTAAAGQSVTISGQNFNTLVEASLNGLSLPITVVTENTLTVTVPEGAIIGKIKLSYSGSQATTQENLMVIPTASEANSISQTSFIAQWTDVGATGYYLDVSTDNFNTFVSGYDNLLLSNTTSLNIAGLMPATTYQYRVRSANGSELSASSNTVQLTTLPSTPVATDATLLSQTSFTANWTASPGALSYDLDVALENTFSNFAVGYNNLNVSGNSVTSQSVSGLTPYTAYYFRVRARNNAGVTVSSNVIKVVTLDNTPPVINAATTSNPSTVSTGVSINLNSVITDNVIVDSAWLFYRGIAQPAFNCIALQGPGGLGGNYSITTQPSWYDSLGLEYYFQAVDKAGNTTASTRAFIQLINSSISLPTLPFGSSESDYRIISFPYLLPSGNTIPNVYANIPWDDPTKAGLWWWNPSLKNNQGSYEQYSEDSDLQSIDPGNGYWVITSNPATPLLSNVPAPRYNQSNLYSMTLKPKWNQIGNPYPIAISWADVVAYNQQVNPGAVFSPLNVFDGSGYKTASTLHAFEGGFVKNLSSSDVTIQIPFPGQTNSGGRVASSNHEFSKDISTERWNCFLHISQQGMTNQLGGFGMHPMAVPGEDQFDNFNPPGLLQAPQVNFKKSEFSDIEFSTDMVTSQDHYTWQFTPTGVMGQVAELSWTSELVSNRSQQLFLFDEELVQAIDMTVTTQYDFVLSPASRFRIVYGSNISDKVVTTVAAGKPYPNPINHEGRFMINLALPFTETNNMLNLQIYNSQGALVHTQRGTVNSGVHRLDVTFSNAISSGIYIYKLMVLSNQSTSVFSGKIVKQ